LESLVDADLGSTSLVAEVNSVSLQKKLERFGVLGDPKEFFKWKLLHEMENAPSVQIDEGASRFFEMTRRLKTFWVDEYGTVRSLGPVGKKERAPDGTWKRKFAKYINQVSSEIVRSGLEFFAQTVRAAKID
jgi:hypothetical protein